MFNFFKLTLYCLLIGLAPFQNAYAVITQVLSEQVSLALLAQERGQYKQVIAIIEPEITGDLSELATTREGRFKLAQAAGVLGLSYFYLGDGHNASKWLDFSQILSRKEGFKALEARALINQSQLRQNFLIEHSGSFDQMSDEVRLNFSQTIKNYQRAALLSESSGEWSIEVRARIYSARIALMVERHHNLSSNVEFNKALEILEHNAKKPESWPLMIALVDAWLMLDKEAQLPNNRLESLLNKMFEYSRSIGEARLQSYLLAYQSRLKIHSGQFQQALMLSQRALMMIELSGQNDIGFMWQAQIADIYQRQGDDEKAIYGYQRSKKMIDSVRETLPQYDAISGRSLFRERVEPIYNAYTELLLKVSAQSNGQNKQRYLENIRNLMESLKSAEIAEYFKDDCISKLGVDLNQSDAQIKGVIVAYPIILADRLELIVSTSDGLHHYTSKIDSARLQALVTSYKNGLMEPTTNDYLKPSQELYDWLIRPFENLFDTNADTLVFIPDKFLRGIPIAALNDGKQFLVAKIALATAVNLELIDTRKTARENKQTLLVGLSQDRQDPLPFVEDEIASLKLLNGGQVLLNQDFTALRLSQDLEQRVYSDVHIATHAKFSDKLEDSYLLAFDNKHININQLEAMIAKTRISGKPIDLLTLSACETAVGNDRAALGLAGVAIKAGARSVLASLWKIRDKSTSILIQSFYQYAKKDKQTKSEALRLAQLQLINGNKGSDDFSHPYYWSAFIMIGNWK